VHLHLVVNPAAGRRNAVPYAEAVTSRLEAAGHRVTRYVTRSPGDGAAHVDALTPAACDVLGVVGGDGTLADLVDGRRQDVPWPLALVPMGTANLVARELGMPLVQDATETAQALASGVPWPVDLMRVVAAGGRRRRAIANVGVGADAEMVRTIHDLRAGAEGSGGYARWVGPALKTIGAFGGLSLRVEVDGRRTFGARACVIQNAACYGGLFRLSPTAGLASGALDVMIVRGRAPRDLLALSIGALLRRLGRDKTVRFVRADRVRVTSPEAAPVQADGDPVGTTTLEVERLPGVLRLWKATR
jgi:diacylglycerol kinase family enzyme